MKIWFLLIFLCCFHDDLLAQKPVIDVDAVTKWPYMGNDAIISDDGNYFLYHIGNKPVDGYTLVIQSAVNAWQMEFPGVLGGGFSADSKQAFFEHNDTLCLLTLSSGQLEYIPDVGAYHNHTGDSTTWIAWTSKSHPDKLFLRDLSLNTEKYFNNVSEYAFAASSNLLLLNIKDHNENMTRSHIQLLDLSSGKVNIIWSDTTANKMLESYSFDKTGDQVVFIIKDQSNRTNSLWYYKTGMPTADLLLSNKSAGIPPGLSIDRNQPAFSPGGKYIFFSLQIPPDSNKIKAEGVQVDVWSYKDKVIQSAQLLNVNNPKINFKAVVGIETGRCIQLEQNDELCFTYYNYISDFVITEANSSITDFWRADRKTLYLVSLKDGARIPLNADKNNSLSFVLFYFSPGGKYLIYYDLKRQNYYSYNLLSAKLMNISKQITKSLELNPPGHYPIGLAGWLANDSAVFIYDEYDIWKVDPSGNDIPVNITNGWGRKNRIKLRLLDKTPLTLPANKPVLLTGFNTANKFNSFYSRELTNKADPLLLSMGPYHIYTSPNQVPIEVMLYPPRKAMHANKWLVLRQSITDAPSYFLTTDFKTFRRLTNLQPQKEYNWLTNELITWKKPDGTNAQGLLYKPENFDSTKKYPLIFLYYEQKSQNKFAFIDAAFSGAGINIPWFVSRGYLVFIPDISYKPGKTGASVCNAVISAALHFKNLPWTDSTKIGINGHSFGGYETNYLVTHSNIFAAAVSAAGTSDFISEYGGLQNIYSEARSNQDEFEVGQYRVGTSLWQHPDLYIENSPIFKADKVVTPLLLIHNKKDDLVPWTQSVELFNALRRLEKKVWMLQYDNGAHGVGGKEAEDCTIRITQFFDYYLKGCPPPRWMTQGIPAKFKGAITGYELDDTKDITP